MYQQPPNKYKKVKFVRPCLLIMQQNQVIDEPVDKFQARVQDFMDDRRAKGEGDGMQMNWLGNAREGLTVCITYLELDRIATIDPMTGEEVASESPSGLVTPTQKKIVPIT